MRIMLKDFRMLCAAMTTPTMMTRTERCKSVNAVVSIVYSEEKAAGKPFDWALEYEEYVMMRTGG